jgi:putative flavoprotein involved in K+ transport
VNDSSPAAQAADWRTRFDAALRSRDIDAATALFGDECFWRDLVAFTWNIKTLEGRDEIAAMLAANLEAASPSHWRLEGEPTLEDGAIETSLTFETAVARGRAHLRLRQGKAWTLLTTMAELKGHEEKKGPSRIKGVEHGSRERQKNWLEKRREEEEALGFSEQPYCIIVGGGQGGIALGARMKRLGVPTIILERNERPGDSWRKRYKSLVLHDPVWYDHLPYLPFPDDWPIFTPKDKMGDWLEMYAKVMELDYWASSECVGASFDDAARLWTVQVSKRGEPVTLTAKQLVLATGAYGPPNEIAWPGIETFRGDHLHSSQYLDGEPYGGKSCVVIGSNNSAHDVCADLWRNGADVTMIQRSSTHVVRSDSLMKYGFENLYSESALEAGVSTEQADFLFASVPFAIMHRAQIPIYEKIKKIDAAFYERLRKVGFMLDFGDDESGLMMKALRRATGYYIDVGASDLIAEGKIGLKSGVEVRRVKARSVELSDGSELPADLIVAATGYGSMNGWAAKLISREVADKVGICWGLGSNTTRDPGPWEGELRNMWKPTRQPALWFHGGNLHLSRYYSQFVALQIKARMEGVPTPVYGLEAESAP